MKLDASDLRLTLSPDVLELGSLLAAGALEPLMQVVGAGRTLAVPLLCCSCCCTAHGRMPCVVCLRVWLINCLSSSLHPLLQPQPDQPLASCNQFERVWCFDPAALLAQQAGGQLAVSLAVTGAEGGVTVWRAKTPTGYAVAGDIVTPGTSQVSRSVRACWHANAPDCLGFYLPCQLCSSKPTSCLAPLLPLCLPCSPHLRCWRWR